MSPQEEAHFPTHKLVVPGNRENWSAGVKRRFESLQDDDLPLKKVKYRNYTDSNSRTHPTLTESYTPSSNFSSARQPLPPKLSDSPASLIAADIAEAHNPDFMPLPPAASLPGVDSSNAQTNSIQWISSAHNSCQSVHVWRTPSPSAPVSLLQSMGPTFLAHQISGISEVEAAQPIDRSSEHSQAPTMSHLTTSVESAVADVHSRRLPTNVDGFGGGVNAFGKQEGSVDHLMLPSLRSSAPFTESIERNSFPAATMLRENKPLPSGTGEFVGRLSPSAVTSHSVATEDTSRPRGPPSHVLDPAWALMSLNQRSSFRCTA